MNALNIAANIVELRKMKGVTQEEMASFIGVTKASVSKWENGQSMPDILLLPVLASYFDVSVDRLLGYEPQLSKEQIQDIYRKFSKAFSEEPFEVVFERSEAYVKKYYSCYRFLSQVCVLWINHYMMADSVERRQEILNKIESLCNHITDNCKNTGICSDAAVMRACINVQMGRPERAIDELEELINPYKMLSQSDSLLIQAYMMKGDAEKADQYTQMSMYLHLMELIGEAVQYIGIHMNDSEVCLTTIERIDRLIEIYELGSLLHNVVAIYQYQVAAFMCVRGNTGEALNRLKSYEKIVVDMLKRPQILHGDSYFTNLDNCFEELELGSQMVRDKKLVMNSAISELDNPVFEPLKDMEEYKKIKKNFEDEKSRM